MDSKSFQEIFKDYSASKMNVNKIDYRSFDIEKFKEKYKILQFRYEGDEKWISFKSTIFNDLKEVEKIISVSFIAGKKVYVLMERESNFDFKEFDASGKYKEYSCEEVSIDETDKKINSEKLDIAYNLLINALSQIDERSSNINGKIYVLAKRNKSEIITMNYFIKDGILIRTQTHLRKCNKNDFNNKKRKIYEVKFGANNTLLLFREYEEREDIDMEDLYAIGHFEKKIIPYDKLRIDDSTITRINLLHELVEDFNAEYGEFAQIEFEKYDVLYKVISTVQKGKKEKDETFKNFEKIIISTRFIDDLEKEEISEKLMCISKRYEDLGIQSIIMNNMKKDSLNIPIIHNMDFYKKDEKKDEKNNISNEYISQCITYENLKDGDIDQIAYQVLSELFIKKELYCKKIDRWSYGEVNFYLGIRSRKKLKEKGIENGTVHCFMKVKDNGEFTFEFDPQKIGLEFTKNINLLRGAYNKEKDGTICLIEKDNKIYRIEHTKLIPVITAENKSLAEKRTLEKEENAMYRSRAKEFISNKEMYPYVSKAVFLKDNKFYYTVGLANNVERKIAVINNIYSIHLIGDNNIGDEEKLKDCYDIMMMLEDPYIRSNRTESVRPFVFKYMIEALRIETKCSELKIY